MAFSSRGAPTAIGARTGAIASALISIATFRSRGAGQGRADFRVRTSIAAATRYPWSHTGTPTKDRDRFAALGDGIASAMFATHQTRYALQPGVDLYAAAGTMTDWMYGEAHALSYTIELRPKGGSGFVLPPDQIKPTCDEGLAAVLALAK